MHAVKFFYENLGCFLHPEPEDPITGPRLAISRAHEHAHKPAKLRLGSGKAMAVIESSRATLMADIRPSRPLPPTVMFHDSSWRTTYNWLAEILLDPPRPPYMVVTFGKNPNILHTLRVNVGSDIVHVCGSESLTCHRRDLIRLVCALAEIPGKEWRAASFWYNQARRRPTARTRARETFERIATKHPALRHLARELQRSAGDQMRALGIVHAQLSKDEGLAERVKTLEVA